jgi:hypothetical protein
VFPVRPRLSTARCGVAANAKRQRQSHPHSRPLPETRRQVSAAPRPARGFRLLVCGRGRCASAGAALGDAYRSPSSPRPLALPTTSLSRASAGLSRHLLEGARRVRGRTRTTPPIAGSDTHPRPQLSLGCPSNDHSVGFSTQGGYTRGVATRLSDRQTQPSLERERGLQSSSTRPAQRFLYRITFVSVGHRACGVVGASSAMCGRAGA